MKKEYLFIILGLNIVLLVVSVVFLVSLFSIKGKVALDSDKSPAVVSVATIPEQVKVYINGYYKGRTPGDFEIYSVKGKKLYKLTLLKQGFKKWSSMIEVMQGKKKSLNIELEKSNEY